ncbi:hypothetical protein KAR91_11860 [Candidatus Pacearchaeota archaeon]|nr:hypothetical protein [Candidatus Pacearchaeota archaeon]
MIKWDGMPAYIEDRIVDTVACENDAAYAKCRPSHQFQPKLSIDGNMWCALYGENLQDGVAGFGKSPKEAYLDFDRAWEKELVA